jgi:predicted outer membrane protein
MSRERARFTLRVCHGLHGARNLQLTAFLLPAPNFPERSPRLHPPMRYAENLLISMKLTAFALTLLASSSLLLAQATTTGTSTTGTGGAKKTTLASSDKTFIKNSTESIYFLTSLADKVRALSKDGNVSEGVKTFSGKVGSELGKVWGEIGAIASAAGETLPTTVKGSDKTKLASLGKLKEEKFEKEYAELSSKELKHLVPVMESGSKMAQNPELKEIAAKWLPTVKGLADDGTALTKTAGKK